MNFNVNEDELMRTVELQLKKEGTFDKIRKQATEKLSESPAVKCLERGIQARIGELIKSRSSMTKEELQKLVKNSVETDARLKYEIARQTGQELDAQWIRELLSKDYNEKVTKELDLLR